MPAPGGHRPPDRIPDITSVQIMSSATFRDKVLLATGGGSGLAAATARRFAAQGGRVAVLDLDRSRAEAVAAELDGSIGLACDVSDEASVQQAVGETTNGSAGSTAS